MNGIARQMAANLYIIPSKNLSSPDTIYFDCSFSNTIKPIYVQPLPRSATIMDGAKTIHAASLYKAKIKPPFLPKNAFNVLEYIGDERWVVTSNDEEIRT